MMPAVQYLRSVPRYLTARLLGPRWKGIYTSRLGCIRLAQVELPRLPGPQWARVRPRLSGVCGSDLATITAAGSTFFSPLTSTPFILGHEVVGEVVEIGSEVREVAVGDRVVLEPALHCQVRGIAEVCPQCRAGRPAHCENVTRGVISAGIQTGFCRDTGGGWSDSLVAHWIQLHRAPEGLPDHTAVLAEPFSCCLHAVRKSGLKDSDTALILGCGTMGILTIGAIRALGRQSRIIAAARYPHQQDWARRLGADRIVKPSRRLLEELAGEVGARLYQPEIGRPTGLGGADVCFDCVGSDRTIDDSLRLTRARGTVMIVGMPSIPRSVDWTSMWYKELNLFGSYTTESATFRLALKLIAEAGDRFQGIVGPGFRLEEYRQALNSALNSSRPGVIKTAFVRTGGMGE